VSIAESFSGLCRRPFVVHPFPFIPPSSIFPIGGWIPKPCQCRSMAIPEWGASLDCWIPRFIMRNFRGLFPPLWPSSPSGVFPFFRAWLRGYNFFFINTRIPPSCAQFPCRFKSRTPYSSCFVDLLLSQGLFYDCVVRCTMEMLGLAEFWPAVPLVSWDRRMFIRFSPTNPFPGSLSLGGACFFLLWTGELLSGCGPRIFPPQSPSSPLCLRSWRCLLFAFGAQRVFLLSFTPVIPL